MSSLDRIEKAAAILVEAHRTGTAIESLPAGLVTSPAEAYAVQERVVHLLDSAIVGWKAGFDASGQSICAPIMARVSRQGGPELPVAGNTPCAIEVEIAYILDADVPAAAPVADSDSIVSQIALGMELIQSRYQDRAAQPFLSMLADGLANGGYYLAASSPRADAPDLETMHLTIMRDSETIWDKTIAHPQVDPAAPLRALLAAPPSHCGGLRKGQFITTGTLNGAPAVPVPSSIAAITVIGPLAAKLVKV
ncbi:MULTISPECIES: hypothetical protein [unclassified Chelatococcus]|uniref:hypothetical protein n=1 Tax=unclassified Chelatococcus TaxID=2638111 RepID=UPI001BCE4DE0|nr:MULTISPECIES: hypothetical protein [unclassified Chelatococcus]CAH1662225.1 2-keto-4-pentenoate hydratase [Hyphomicrobiales bacterium]MBS7741361.1 hypothetical protein [Chelatococcus sp. HY11]MBX3546157.1 hypothetical protein [Chelatococcus sp.]MCO5077194.1 hypothetical protein [Chelatococcus sp.]CAH1682784.1 2-keto-4-pentenoate hydratase [Hyphomicrobiales bacterium]